MAEELQSLLDKINAEGIKKAEAEKKEILEKAEKQAAEIIEKASAEAKLLTETAKKENAALYARTEASIRQAARDIMLQLRANMQKRLDQIIRGAVCQALTPEEMAAIIRDIASQFTADNQAEISIRCSANDADKLKQALKNALTGSFVCEPRLFPDKALTSGLEISFRNGEGYYDFSSDAIAELVSEYAGTQLADVFKGE